jgi:hypothetical protein
MRVLLTETCYNHLHFIEVRFQIVIIFTFYTVNFTKLTVLSLEKQWLKYHYSVT